jgi:hypothetical protein
MVINVIILVDIGGYSIINHWSYFNGVYFINGYLYYKLLLDILCYNIKGYW